MKPNAALISLLAGAVSNLVFVHSGFGWLIYPVLGFLFFRAATLSPQGAYWIGFQFALGLYLVGAHWLIELVPAFHGLNALFGVFIILLVSGVLSAFIGLATLCFQWVQRLPTLLASASVAALWVAQDGLRTALLDWPWLKLGYTQLDSPIGGFATIGGEPLVTFVCVLVAALLARMLRLFRSTTKTPRQVWLMGLAVGTLFASGALLKEVNWTSSKGTAVTVNLLQANIPIDQKWDARYRDTLMEYYANLAERSSALYEDSSNLVINIMPETALPVPLHTIGQEYWSHLASNDQAALLTGITEVLEGQGNKDQVSNAAVFRCDGVNTVYRKRTLVPFGERLPFAAILGDLYEAIGLNAANYRAGDAAPALACGGVSLAVAVCFEIMFNQTDWGRDFDILININEEGWYFQTLAPVQRLFYARMRAMEMARPIVSMSNNGPSVVIDHRGRITDLTEVNQAVLHTSSIELRSGLTPYHQYGNTLIWGIVGLILLLTVLAKITVGR